MALRYITPPNIGGPAPLHFISTTICPDKIRLHYYSSPLQIVSLVFVSTTIRLHYNSSPLLFDSTTIRYRIQYYSSPLLFVSTTIPLHYYLFPLLFVSTQSVSLLFTSSNSSPHNSSPLLFVSTTTIRLHYYSDQLQFYYTYNYILYTVL